jgi:hypothetical protein
MVGAANNPGFVRVDLDPLTASLSQISKKYSIFSPASISMVSKSQV